MNFYRNLIHEQSGNEVSKQPVIPPSLHCRLPTRLLNNNRRITKSHECQCCCVRLALELDLKVAGFYATAAATPTTALLLLFVRFLFAILPRGHLLENHRNFLVNFGKFHRCTAATPPIDSYRRPPPKNENLRTLTCYMCTTHMHLPTVSVRPPPIPSSCERICCLLH